MAHKRPIPPPEQFVGLSCLAVGAGLGGSTSMLAYVFGKKTSAHCSCSGPLDLFFHRRVAIVDYRGNDIYHKFVQPTIGVIVTDYRTATTGITADNLQQGTRLHQPSSCMTRFDDVPSVFQIGGLLPSWMCNKRSQILFAARLSSVILCGTTSPVCHSIRRLLIN